MHKSISGLTGRSNDRHGNPLYRRTGRSRRRRLMERARLQVAKAGSLYPPDCYGPDPKGIAPDLFFLQDEDPYDMVARLENAELAGMTIPEEFTPHDLLVAFIPSRRVVAFGYSVLQEDHGVNFRKACIKARIPQSWAYHYLPRYPLVMHFLSAFWKERVTSMQGMTFVYAAGHARTGSAPHLKLLAELNGLSAAPSPAGDTTNIQINMPDAPRSSGNGNGNQDQKALPAHTIDADAELFEDPA